MGCSPHDDYCNDDEKPPHVVSLSPFQILDTEVTEAQYEALMGGDPSCNLHGGGGPDNPVENVDWHQASDFCAAVGGRLPTEVEWEYAARAGATTTYPCGEEQECLDKSEWYYLNAESKKHAVGGKQPNAFGLYDTVGNLAEWTADWYAGDYYQVSPATDPPGPDSGTYRVVRGGGIANDGDYELRVSGRYYNEPTAETECGVGFRCVRSVKP